MFWQYLKIKWHGQDKSCHNIMSTKCTRGSSTRTTDANVVARKLHSLPSRLLGSCLPCGKLPELPVAGCWLPVKGHKISLNLAEAKATANSRPIELHESLLLPLADAAPDLESRHTVLATVLKRWQGTRKLILPQQHLRSSRRSSA